jgi:hypothetical protein
MFRRLYFFVFKSSIIHGPWSIGRPTQEMDDGSWIIEITEDQALWLPSKIERPGGISCPKET